jgi:hypothetical protein
MEKLFTTDFELRNYKKLINTSLKDFLRIILEIKIKLTKKKYYYKLLCVINKK